MPKFPLSPPSWKLLAVSFLSGQIGFVPAGLVSQVAAGDVYSSRRVTRGSATASLLAQVG